MFNYLLFLNIFLFQRKFEKKFSWLCDTHKKLVFFATIFSVKRTHKENYFCHYDHAYICFKSVDLKMGSLWIFCVHGAHTKQIMLFATLLSNMKIYIQ